MKNVIINKEDSNQLYESVRNVLIESRNKSYVAVNSAMVYAYWSIGKLIVEDEQNGNFRGEYGKNILVDLSIKLTSEFGEGFTVRSLQMMKKFYTVFPNASALRSQLTWTHYRSLLKVEDKNARNWYIDETIKEGWSSRQLDRQISTLYYERLLASKEKEAVIEEANEKISKIGPEQFIKDPYVLEFIDLKDYPALRETNLEQALIDNIQKFLLELGRGFALWQDKSE